MKKIILNLIILLLSINIYSQNSLKEYEGIWSTANSFFYKVFTYNEEDDILEVYSFSFGSDAAVVEKIVKIKKDAVYTKSYNYDNKWKVKIKYNMIDDELQATYSGDIDSVCIYKKATLVINN